jgi:hypothetical protein
MLSLKVHLRKKNLYCWLILHTLLHTNYIATKDDDASKFAYISLLRFSKLFKNSMVVPVRSISNSNAEKDLYEMRKLCHENPLTVHEIFDFDSSFYIISERMHITLDVTGPALVRLSQGVWLRGRRSTQSYVEGVGGTLQI